MRALWVAGVLGLVFFVLHLELGFGKGQAAFDGFYVVLYLVPAGLCITRGLTLRSERAAWVAVGCGMAAWAAGYAYFFLLLQHLKAPPYPSPADAMWLSYPVAVLAGVVLVARKRIDGFGSGVWIDGVTGVLALGSLSAALLVGPILASTGGKFEAVATNLAYPMLDVLILGVVLGVSALSGWRPGRTWLIVGAAFALQIVADWIYLYQAASGTYKAGTLLDVSWPAAMLLVAFAAWHRPTTVRTAKLDGWPVLVVPSLFAALALGLTTYDHFHRIPTVAVLLTTATLATAFGRAMTAFAQLRTRAQSRELNARHELILNSAGEAIFGLDAEGRTTFVNHAAEQLTGYLSDELIGRSPHPLTHHTKPDGSPYPEEECPIMRVLQTGEARKSEAELFWRKDGTSFPIEYSCTPLEEGGKLAGAVLVFRDITERREVERLKDEFTSVVSHELRTPLTSIRGSLGLLAAGTLGELPEKGQRMVDIAVQNTDRLVRLINDILDIERIESGRATMEMEPCQAETLVYQAADVMGSMAEAAGVELVVDSEPASLCADPDRIVQALTNLLSNAIKFSSAGDQVSLSSQLRGGDVLFSVHDRGRGIPEDKLETVFERFAQVDASDSRDKGGTGLGLPICRSIVEHHGGRIWVESKAGEGSSFHFTLPGRAVKPLALPVEPQSRDDQSPTVLVCDDDPAVLEVVGAMLEARGYRVLLAASGAEAVEYATAQSPDVILLDLVMPGMDGWQTADALREQLGAKEAPIVILSVLAEAESEQPSGDVVDWLEKPPHERSLFQAIERAVDRHSHASRVLVVEDDEDLASVLREMFERNGINSLHAATGGKAIELSQRTHPDLLVLDVGLPGLDGFAVVDWLKRHESLHSVPLVVYTARDLSDSDRQRLELGDDTEFLTKGRVDPEEFERRVMKLLDRISANGAEGPVGAKAHSGRR